MKKNTIRTLNIIGVILALSMLFSCANTAVLQKSTAPADSAAYSSEENLTDESAEPLYYIYDPCANYKYCEDVDIENQGQRKNVTLFGIDYPLTPSFNELFPNRSDFYVAHNGEDPNQRTAFYIFYDCNGYLDCLSVFSSALIRIPISQRTEELEWNNEEAAKSRAIEYYSLFSSFANPEIKLEEMEECEYLWYEDKVSVLFLQYFEKIKWKSIGVKLDRMGNIQNISFDIYYRNPEEMPVINQKEMLLFAEQYIRNKNPEYYSAWPEGTLAELEGVSQLKNGQWIYSILWKDKWGEPDGFKIAAEPLREDAFY